MRAAPLSEARQLRRRADFLAAAKGRKVAMRTLVLQLNRTGRDEVRIGFTVSRKVGNAVERNRVRRRLRHALRSVSRSSFLRGHDYVLIGRRRALSESFGRIVADLEAAVTRAHRPAATARTGHPDG